jgi:hypothetical protein
MAAMRAPAGLSGPARRAWRDAVATLQLTGADPVEHTGRLDRYARAAGRLVELEEQWRAAGGEWHEEGSRGQLVVHPDLVEMRELAEHVEALADKLFGTPARRGGWQLGNARAPDRQYRRGGKVVAMPGLRRALDRLDSVAEP